jgi:hypothetical protein
MVSRVMNLGFCVCGVSLALSAPARAYTEEHAYGYEISLWRADSCLFGFLSASEGLIGDTPTGQISDVFYDAASGNVSFMAKLSTGAIHFEKHYVPSWDLFLFRGRIETSRMTGTVTHLIFNYPAFQPVTETVVLSVLEKDQYVEGAETFGEWRKQWGEMLKRLGPRW